MATEQFFRIKDGRPFADSASAFDVAWIPTSDQKAAFPTGASGANQMILDDDSRLSDARTPLSHGNEAHDVSFITSSGVTYEALSGNGDIGTGASTVAAGDDSRFLTATEAAGIGAAPNAITASNPAADKQYVDQLVQGLDWQESVQHDIQYVKSTTGAPTGTPSTGEKCLNTADHTLYTESTGAWDAGAAISNGDRFIFKTDGTDVTGNSGTFTKDNKIRTYDSSGGGSYTEFTPTAGAATYVEDQLAQYTYTGSAWTTFGSTTVHNNTTGLQGGQANEYYHLTANQHAGIAAATAITASNPPLTSADRDMVPVAIKFIYKGGFAASQTDVEMYEQSGSFQRILMPSAGSIVKTTMQATGPRTAGTLTAEPTVDGTKVTANDLDMVFDGSTTNDDRAEVAPATTNLTFNAGQKLGVKLTSDGAWLPVNVDIEVTLYVVFNT